MDDLIKTGGELRQAFFDVSTQNDFHRGRFSGYKVRAKIRADILADGDQGRIVINGKVRNIDFESIGGGMWNATVSFD